jgi:type I restriction enzyme M protein
MHSMKCIENLQKGQGADPEDPDEYKAENVFWVLKEARWKNLQGNAKQPVIGKLVDGAIRKVQRQAI